MATPPTFIQERETAWNSDTSPKTTASFNVLANDVLVAFSIDQGYNSVNTTISGGSLTWSLRQSIRISSYCQVCVWTAVVDSNKSMTVSFDKPTSDWFGGNVFTFRGSDGYDNSAKTNVSSGAPTLNLHTLTDNCAVVVVNGDWNAVDGASRTWRTNFGTLTEQTYDFESGTYTAYGGYHADAGASATKAVGLSAPGSQKYSIVAVSIKGTTAETASVASFQPATQAPYPDKTVIVGY